MGALHELFEHTSEAIFGIDENRNIRFWNKSCEDLLRVPHQQALGKSCAELLCGKDAEGNSICAKACPIVKAPNAQVFDNHFSLVLETGNNESLAVNVGSYFIEKSYRENNDDVRVFHTVRPVIRRKGHAI